MPTPSRFSATPRAIRLAIAAAVAMFLPLLVGTQTAHADGLRLSKMLPLCKCESLRFALTADDVAQIEKLPAQVIATLAKVKGTPMAPIDRSAVALAKHLANGSFDGKFDRVKAGIRPCTMYWYGFADLRDALIHRRCIVTRHGDALAVSFDDVNEAGNGFAARLVPYLPGGEVFIGRTFDASDPRQTYDKEVPATPAKAAFGNIAGLAVADKGRLTLISINERGLLQTTPVYFLALAID